MGALAVWSLIVYCRWWWLPLGDHYCVVHTGVCGTAIALRRGGSLVDLNAWRASPVWVRPSVEVCCGGVLLSHNLAVAVPLALPGLASRFGMLLGVSPVL